ncbi:MAG: divalent metal cation transporter [Hyphomicrobiales bacterium]|nr:divalent metal cation transporter [Hyphomicrobiales bacterium]
MTESATTYHERERISFAEKMAGGRVGPARRLWLLWALLGPGIISMLANNDSGGMISYTMTGATFGISLFLPLLFLLAPVGYNFQEMSMRLSAVTQADYRELLLRHFGRFWCYGSISALALANLLYIITEFVGMTAGLTLVGLPLWAADLLSFIFVGGVTFFIGYWPKERVILFVGAINVVFIAAAILSHPDPAEIGKVFTSWPKLSWGLGSNGMLVFIMATIGNTVAPFMLYFQNSATIDKELTAKDLRLGRADIALGAILQPLFAMAVMICGAGLVGKVANLDSSNPADLISALVPVAGHLGASLFAIGLFNAGWLAAITISLSSSYAVASAFRSKRSLNHRILEAPRFYGVYFGSLLLGAIIILIPGLPLNIMAVFTQIIAAMLLVPDLIFLVLLTSNPGIMGEYVSRWWKQMVGWAIVALYAAMSAVTIYLTLAA